MTIICYTIYNTHDTNNDHNNDNDVDNNNDNQNTGLSSLTFEYY